MGTKIRVFIASTMKDLANERDAVVRRVRDFNFEPVNAEAWLPGDARIWGRIEKEIESCHLFVLISGESYGWVPGEGPGAGGGLSVTHMEARKARAERLPILPFFKRLGYESPRDARRDDFRREVSSWAGGGVVAEFDLAKDLAEKVTASLVEVLSDSYLSTAVQERAKSVRALEPAPGRDGAATFEIPRPLLKLAAEGKVVLLAGAGISLAAGFPSARAMTETITAHLRRELNSPELSLSGMPFQEVASNIEAAFGRRYLLDIFLRAMSGPQGIEPTEAHLLAVRLFDRIVTTNFDALFEAACLRHGLPYTVVEAYEDIPDPPSGRLIYKLSGSLERPGTLRITEQDVWDAFGDKPAIWGHLIEMVTRLPVLIVGSSLRDTAVKMLFADSMRAVRGYIVSPYINQFERLQYERLNLVPIEATADAFFRELSRAAGQNSGTESRRGG